MPSDETSSNAQTLTPYPNFRFKVAWTENGVPVYVAGIGKVSALTQSTKVVRRREGADPSTMHASPGQTEYAPITFERGLSYDVQFETWANKVYDYDNSKQTAGKEASLKDFRKDLTIDVFNEAGQKVLAYTVYNAWVSDYQAISELDASGEAAIAIQSMTVQNEGWEQDDSVAPAEEPSFTLPRGS